MVNNCTLKVDCQTCTCKKWQTERETLFGVTGTKQCFSFVRVIPTVYLKYNDVNEMCRKHKSSWTPAYFGGLWASMSFAHLRVLRWLHINNIISDYYNLHVEGNGMEERMVKKRTRKKICMFFFIHGIFFFLAYLKSKCLHRLVYIHRVWVAPCGSLKPFLTFSYLSPSATIYVYDWHAYTFVYFRMTNLLSAALCPVESKYHCWCNAKIHGFVSKSMQIKSK